MKTARRLCTALNHMKYQRPVILDVSKHEGLHLKYYFADLTSIFSGFWLMFHSNSSLHEPCEHNCDVHTGISE